MGWTSRAGKAFTLQAVFDMTKDAGLAQSIPAGAAAKRAVKAQSVLRLACTAPYALSPSVLDAPLTRRSKARGWNG